MFKENDQQKTRAQKKAILERGALKVKIDEFTRCVRAQRAVTPQFKGHPDLYVEEP